MDQKGKRSKKKKRKKERRKERKYLPCLGPFFSKKRFFPISVERKIELLVGMKKQQA